MIKQGYPKKQKFVKSKLLKKLLSEHIELNSLKIGSRYNSKYDYQEIQAFFLGMCLEQISGHLAPLVFADNFGFNLPDQQTVRNRIEKYSTDEIEKNGNEFLLKNASKLPTFSNSKKLEKVKKINSHTRRIKAKNKNQSIRQRERMIDPPEGLYLSIDFTLIPFYPKNKEIVNDDKNELSTYLTKNKRKKSTEIFWGYHTIYSTEPGSRYLLGVKMLRRKKNKKGLLKRERLDQVVPKLLDPIIDKIDFKGITADGDYNSIGIYRYLMLKRKDFVIRGKIDQKMKNIMSKVDTSRLSNGEGIVAHRFHIMGIGNNSVIVRLVLVKRGNNIIPLILPPYTQLSPEQALLIYEERFGIETSYREINRYLPPTCSVSPRYRLGIYFFTAFFFNILLTYHEIVVVWSKNQSKLEKSLILIHQKLKGVFVEILKQSLVRC